MAKGYSNDLKARWPRGRYVDPMPTVMRLWDDLQAVATGKAEWIRRPERKLSEEAQAAFELSMHEADRMHERLKAEQGR